MVRPTGSITAETPVFAGANQRQSEFDGAHPRLLEMLVGTGRDPEPAVIGEIDDPARPFAASRNVAGKDRLVADER